MSLPKIPLEEMGAVLWELQQKNAIMELMTDYWWYMDSKQWDKWVDVFTEDVQIYIDDCLTVEGRDKFKEQNMKWLSNVNTVHQGHQTRIKITSPTTATARIMLNDVLTAKEAPHVMTAGYGFYFDDYRLCDDGKWRISVVRLGYFERCVINEAGNASTEVHTELGIAEDEDWVKDNLILY